MHVRHCDSFVSLVCWFQPQNQNGSRERGIQRHNRSLQIPQHSKSIFSSTFLIMWYRKQGVWWSTSTRACDCVATVGNRTSAVTNSTSPNTFTLINGFFRKAHSTVRSACKIGGNGYCGFLFAYQKQPSKSISFQTRQELVHLSRSSTISSSVLTKWDFLSSIFIFSASNWYIKDESHVLQSRHLHVPRYCLCKEKCEGIAIIERFQAAHAINWSESFSILMLENHAYLFIARIFSEDDTFGRPRYFWASTVLSGELTHAQKDRGGYANVHVNKCTSPVPSERT